ncbi:hypothetical protein HY612_01660 [Candidatus Roizmanbacteria bacterium]|nr:hypothetical protein [Candidatus Roizmanbacteria bacterium]
MQIVYIDHNIITAFFLQNHPFHKQAVGDIALFLKFKDHYVCSISAVFESIKELVSSLAKIKESNLLPPQYEIEKQVISQVNSLLKKLNIKILYVNNQQIFSHALSLQLEFNIHFDIAFYTALLQEQKIKIIATYDERYNKLFSEGVLTKYQPKSMPERK